MKEKTAIRRFFSGTGPTGLRGERMRVRNFKDRDSMHKFLNHDDNANWWKETKEGEPVKSGTYAYAGQAWHNVKSLDATTLAHI